MVAAQAVRDATSTEVTEKQSLSMVRSLIRIALYNISYIRGLFPDNYFQDKHVPALEMKVKKLIPLDDESRRLIDWMEKGVYDALQRKYLKTMVFAICEEDATSLLEEYTFSFTYGPEDGACNMELQAGGKTRMAAGSNITPQQMKQASCKMVRTLAQLMRTLDGVPEKRTLVVKLYYYDTTPDDYDPPFFRSCGQEEQLTWKEIPLKMKVGDVDTKHYSLALKVRSVLDPVDGDEEQQASQSSSQGASSASESSLEEPRPTQEASKQVAKKAGAVQPSTVSDSAAEETQDPAFESGVLQSIRTWLQTKTSGTVDMSTVDMVDFLTRFNLSVPLLEGLIQQLVEDGTLVKTGDGDAFRVAGPKGAARASNAAAPTPHKATGTAAVPLCSDGASTGVALLGEPVPVADDSKCDDAAEDDDTALYNLALTHILAMDYVSIANLQEKLGGGISKDQCTRIIERAVAEGLVARAVTPRHRGRKVQKTAAAAARLKEVTALVSKQRQSKRPRAEEDGADVAIVDSLAAYATTIGSADTGSNAVKLGASLPNSARPQDSDKADGNCPAAVGRRPAVAPEISSSKGVKPPLVALGGGAFESQEPVGVSQRVHKASTVQDPIRQNKKMKT